MREVQLRRMRQRKTVWVLGALVLLALGALWWWAAQRPPSIVIPPRQYPPNNAYDAYKQIAQGVSDLFATDARLRDIESRLFRRGGAPVSQAERRYFLQKMQPFLEAYRRRTEQPCVAVYEYDMNWLFPEMAQFRRLARAESLMIRDALAAGREDEALLRLQALLRFSEQIRTEGTLIHYFVGAFVSELGLEPLREWLPKLQSPKTLEALVALAHDAEKRRTPLRSSFTHEYYLGLAFHRDLAQGRLKLQDLERDWGFSSLDPPTLDALLLRSGVGAPFVVKPSLREYQHYYDQLFAELEKPPWERKPVPANPKRFLNQLLFPVFDGATKREQSSMATLRLLACYAAVKRYRQQRGVYPPSLEALRPELGEMIIDPFTGKPFVYRTDPKRGFQLYSVGENLTDDGGRLSANRQQGDLLPITENALPEAQRPRKTRLSSPPVWLR
jgi:hypothetical protein